MRFTLVLYCGHFSGLLDDLVMLLLTFCYCVGCFRFVVVLPCCLAKLLILGYGFDLILLIIWSFCWALHCGWLVFAVVFLWGLWFACLCVVNPCLVGFLFCLCCLFLVGCLSFLGVCLTFADF